MKSVKLIDYINNELYNNYTILDVRSDDFSGGNIPNAVNIPSHEYTKIKEFIKDKNNIIVHCMYSSVRGVGVVKRLTNDFPDKNIILLDGGFNKYFNFIINNKDIDISYIENLNRSLWILNNNNEFKHIRD